jgi:molybdopterin/thiamine biosynthesis adenylyltransferase
VTAWRLELDATRDRFLHEIRKIGFSYVEERSVENGAPTVRGTVPLPGGLTVDVEIELRDGFPYRPQRVSPTEDTGRRSWHQERDGSLCLWTGSEDDLPWTNPTRLVKRIADWFVQEQAGWPDDEPDLDLERYFDAENDARLLVYEDIHELLGRRIKTRPGANGTIELIRSGKSAARIRRKHGWVVDVGVLDRPIHNWLEVADRLGDWGEQIEAEMRRVGGGHLLAVYQRGRYRGVVALRVKVDGDDVALSALESADRSPAIVRMRAGRDAEFLSAKAVAVVGVGAVGSFIADLLARAGIGRLILCDNVRLRPGNCVRHLAGREHVGKTKPAAVRDVLIAAGHGTSTRLEDRKRVESVDEAADLSEQVDLLVDATGRAPIAALLADAARHIGKSCVCVYLQRDGGIARVDRWPLDDGEAHPDAISPLERSGERLQREAGCGEPVSHSPAHAVVSAASIGAGAIVDLLCGRNVPPSIIQVLGVQPGEAYKDRQIIT